MGAVPQQSHHLRWVTQGARQEVGVFRSPLSGEGLQQTSQPPDGETEAQELGELSRCTQPTSEPEYSLD